MVEMVLVVGKEEEEEEEMVFTASFTAPPGADALMWAQSRATLIRAFSSVFSVSTFRPKIYERPDFSIFRPPSENVVGGRSWKWRVSTINVHLVELQARARGTAVHISLQ